MSDSDQALFAGTEGIAMRRIADLVALVSAGRLVLPVFQRDAIWSEGRQCALWDSVLRGFPMPAFFLARLEESWALADDPLAARGSSTEANGDRFAILDGQQRLMALRAGFARDAGGTAGPDASTWLWLDLAPKRESHPLGYRFWVMACTRVSPFGFSLQRDGDHDLKPLTDRTTAERLADWPDHEPHEVPLCKSPPHEAGYPVPLHAAVRAAVRAAVGCTGSELRRRLEDLGRPHARPGAGPSLDHLREVADALGKVHSYRLLLQRVNATPEDSFTLFERLGRGGVQMTDRQIATSRLLLDLGRAGNDAIARFQQNPRLRHLLDTEAIVHAAARVAVAESRREGGAAAPTRDPGLVSLDTASLRQAKANHEGLEDRLRGYCSTPDAPDGPSRLEQAFEAVFTAIRHGSDNPAGFSLVQLALPKAKGGLEPLTLHPLLYLTLGLGLGRRAAGTERTDWLRWLLAANGLLAQPANELLNRVVLDLVVERGELRREAVQQAIFALPPLGRGPSEEQDRIAWLTKLGLELAEPHLPEIGPPEDVARVLDRFPTPDEVEGLMLKRMLLRGWAGSRNNNFILLWNQRVPLEAFFGGVSYIPVLFSKGSPLDGDHVAARSLFKHSGAHGVDRASMAGAVDSLLADPAIARLVDAAELPRLRARATVTPQAFRLAFSDCLANRSFLPKWLNRSVQDLRVVEKLSLPRIQAALKGTPLAPTLSGLLARPDGQGGDPHDWSAIPPGDRVAWDTVPPERAARWDAPTIATFMRAILGRERFLYANAHDLVMLGPGSSASGHHGSDPSDAGGGPPA